ncbi:hypothetical protein V8E53_003970 [Lactarius tabidus]
MPSRPTSKFLSRPSIVNPIKSPSTTRTHDNEASVKAFQNALKRSLESYNEPSVVAAALDAFLHMSSIDDRLMALEYIVSFISENADGILKDQAAELETKMVEILYEDLPHPPATYIGAQYQYRTADGSYNNICVPDMGKASTPYARSVQQVNSTSLDTLPDPGLVFDTLLKRRRFQVHPAGCSSLMFSWAALVIHSVFRTSHENVSINETSSYADLAPLYGNDQKTSNEIRVHDGRGMIHPDTFAEDRLLLLPPAVCTLLVLFSRNHNYIASKLLEINERQTYKKPEEITLDDPERPKKISDQDEDIFQTARLINCGWFAGIIFSDYLSSILGLVRQGSRWSLNPFGEIRDSDHKLFERGRGNVCSVEFNLLYRWHATASQADEQWTTKLMSDIFPDQPVDEITIDDFKVAFKKMQAQEPVPTQWTFGGLQRGTDGKFDDTQLAAVLKDAIEQPAAAFGARGTPQIMRLQEIMGIEANRSWGVCSLNEFRKFLGLKTYESFLEWNPDKEIAEAAEHLYHHIDRLELYVGLMAEDAKKPVEGAGLCPGYTISRAILSDAIALTRGDRFFTTDCTPYNLTPWGLADIQRDPQGPGIGNMLGRLFNRCLPGEFSPNSVFTWYPYQTPASMEVFLRRLGTANLYDFSRPPDRPLIAIAAEYNDVQQILGSAQFRPLCGDKVARILSGEGFFLASNKGSESQRDQREVLRVMGGQDQTDQIVQYFYEKTRELIKVKSYSLTDKNTKYVDIVRDVLRVLPTHWAATSLAGLTLKADNESWGDYTESQLYEMITEIYSVLFLDLDPSKAMNIEASAKEHIKSLQRRIRTKITIDVEGKLTIANLVGTLRSLFSAKELERKQKLTLAESLFENGASIERTTNNVLSLLIGASVELSQSIINVVNFYIDMPDIVKQFRAAGPTNPALEGYVYEAMRIDPPIRGVYRESLANQTVGNLTFSKSQRVFVDLARASLDPNVFPDPRMVNVNREPRHRYLTGDGVTCSLGVELTTKIIASVLRAVFECNDVRRAPGRVGHLRRFKVDTENTQMYEYLDSNNLPTAWPGTMLLQYDITPQVNAA